MTYKPSLQEIANTKTKLQSKGIYWPDAKIATYLVQEQENTKWSGAKSSAVMPSDVVSKQQEAGVTENILDAVGSFAWNAIDTATFGVGGLAMEKMDPELYESMQYELNDTLGGRLGGTVGSLAGFMVPMGWVSKGTSLAVRGLRTAHQERKIVKAVDAVKKGKSIENALNIKRPTTSIIQKQAALKIMESERKIVGHTSAKLSFDDALDIAKQNTDDLIGFTSSNPGGWKGVMSQVTGGKGPAYQMGHSREFVEQSKLLMQNTLPDRIAASLSEKGITGIGKRGIQKISDDVIKTVGRKPFNQIEEVMGALHPPFIGKTVMPLVGGMVQEAVNFGIVGTAMDYAQYLKGEKYLDLKEHSFPERMLHHAVMGSFFGGVRFVPGGRNAKIWDDIKFRTRSSTKKLNKQIREISDIDELKALARLQTINNGASFKVNGKILVKDQLRKGYGIGPKDMNKLKQSMVDYNNRLFDSFKKNWLGDIGSDIVGSLPRMGIGSIIFNWAALEGGAFDNMSEAELFFNLGLGAIMTKGYRPLKPGGEGKAGIHMGERPYYYTSDMRDIVRNFKSLNINTEHIGSIVKQFEGDLFQDWVAKYEHGDIKNIIDTLEKEGVVHKAEYGTNMPDSGKAATLTDQMANLLMPISAQLKTRDYVFNVNVTEAQQTRAIELISKMESQVLSTPEKKVLFNSAGNIRKAILEGAARDWARIDISLLDSFKQQFQYLTGNENFIREDGRMPDYRIEFDKKETLLPELEPVLSKLMEVQNHLKSQDKIKIDEIQIEQGKGVPITITNKKLRELREIQDVWESDWGKEFYGENLGESIKMNDPMLLNTLGNFDYHNNVVKVYDMLEGNPVAGWKQPDLNKVESLIGEIFSNPSNKDPRVIAENPSNIVIDYKNTSITAGSAEANALEGFKKDLWATLTATGRAPVDGTPTITIKAEKLLELSDKMSENGLPNPVEFALDSRLSGFFDRLRTHAIEQVTGGLDMDLQTSAAVKRLMLEGLIQRSGVGTDGYSLTAARELSVAEIQNAASKTLKDSEVKEIQDNWQFIMTKINEGSSKNLVHMPEGHRYTSMSGENLTTINATRKIFEIENLAHEIFKTNETVNEIIIGSETKIRELEIQLEDLGAATNNSAPGARKQILTLLTAERLTLDTINSFHVSFRKSFGGTPEVTRASAHMQLFKEKDLIRKLSELDSRDPDFKTKTKEIKDLQVEIANTLAERPDVQTSFEQQRVEDTLRRIHAEPEGTIKKEHTNITVESFITDRKIDFNDLYNEASNISALTEVKYNNINEAVTDLYYNTVRRNEGGIEKFSDILFKLAGDNKFSADSKLRNEVQTLANAMERKYEVRRLTVSKDSGSGMFENSEISKGFLTDSYSEIFKGEAGILTMLQPDFHWNGRIQSIASNDTNFKELETILGSGGFYAGEQKGGVNALKYFGEGVILENTTVESYKGIDLAKQYIKGKQYIIGVDENIRIVVPDSGFDALAKSFIDWYAINKGSANTPEGNYTMNVLKQSGSLSQNTKNLMAKLSHINAALEKSMNTSGEITSAVFSKHATSRDYLESSVFTMFNVMYGQKANKNWLVDAYFDGKSSNKEYKYKRLAQNQGYTRDSMERNQNAKVIWEHSNDTYAKKLVKKYADKEIGNAFIIEDSQLSVTGSDANKLITDNRSITEAQLENMWNNQEITKESYNSMKKTIREGHSLNAEAPNGATVVRREFLDWELLRGGNRHMIGESSGQKPVGLSSYTDANGVIHVFYNKTHYFYDSRFDKFFKNNPHIDQIALTSGVKKHNIIDPSDPNLQNKLKPYGSKDSNSNTPTLAEANNMVEWINKIDLNMKQGGTHESVFPIKLDQTLSGVTYGKAKDAKVLKQFDNWTSAEASKDIYEYARADLASTFAMEMIPLMNPERTDLASAEAKSFLKRNSEGDGTISNEVPNPSFAALWLEGDGVPFSAISSNLYTSMIKKRYIDDAGVFDGRTDAGGTPVIRPNWSGDLKIPIYKGDGENRVQIKLGEVHVGEAYLDRKITFKQKVSGGSYGAAENINQRPRKNDASSLTVAVAHNGRDVIIDLVKKEVYDPEGRITKLDGFKEGESVVNDIVKKFSDGELETWGDVRRELLDNHSNAQLVVIAPPGPRTGPHDAIVAKIKGVTPTKDGGVMEMNSYDVTMRAQRDYDTDKMSFYMDSPFSVLKESYQKNGIVLEAEPLNANELTSSQFDPYDMNSYNKKDIEINKFKKLRGPVMKMQRKLTYAKQLMDKIGGIDLGDGTRLVFTGDMTKAMGRLVKDAQGVLDIYNGVPKYLEDGNYQNNVLFGDNKKTNINAKTVEPWFQIETKTYKEVKDKAGNITNVLEVKDRVSITNDQHKHIINKVLNDFGRLLNLESSIWEAGEAKTPRYEDMVSEYSIFRNEYDRKNVNWNFYHYISKRVNKAAADAIFFKDGKSEGGAIKDILGSLSEQINNRTSPFLKSLHAVARKDHLRIRKTYGEVRTDNFNDGIAKLLGQNRANTLAMFENTGIMLEGKDFDAMNNHVKDLWDHFHRGKKHEELFVQTNVIESEIQRAEYLVAAESRKNNPDQAFIDIHSENLLVKRKALQMMLDKLSIRPDPEKPGESPFGQTLTRYRKDKNNKVYAYTRDVLIRDGKTGQEVRRLRDGDSHELKPNEVAVYNPVTLKPVIEHEMIDGLAFAKSTLGYYSRIKEFDLPQFRTIVHETRNEIRKSMSDLMETNGYRDWTKHESLALASIDKGFEKLKKLIDINADKERSNSPLVESGLIGNVKWMIPADRKTYAMDFLMAMLVPDFNGNPNQFHFSPKTQSLVPVIGKPNKATIRAVMGSIEKYGLASNFPEFIKDFASVHRGFYDTFVAGRGFHEGLDRLAETNFEGALLKTMVEKSMNKPFMERKHHKNFSEEMEVMGRIGGMKSDFAEMFRQILQEGALTDPQTVFNLRRQIIEGDARDGLGPDAYEKIFTLSRGRIVMDGLGGKQYSLGQGEGQLLGEVIMSGVEKSNRRYLRGRKKTSLEEGASINDQINQVIGTSNETDQFGVETKCN